MADENRAAAFDLIAAVAREPHAYSFLQLMRLLECAYQDKARFGQAKLPKLEPPIRLGQEIALSFEAATLNRIITSDAAQLPPILKQRFFGLFGTNGPLPLYLTEHAYERIHHHDDTSLEGFADVFHHRMLGLFYRAFANAEPTINFDRPETDKFSFYMGAFSGLGDSAVHNRDAMPDVAKFYYSGFLSGHTKHAEGLRAILADYFRLQVSIDEFVGEWLELDKMDLTRLGETPRTGELGFSAILGSKVWSCQHKFRICFQGLSLSEYLSLLPNGQRIEQMIAIVRNYIGDELSWDVLLVLKKAQVPQSRLGEYSQLGWTSWLGQRHSDEDADDLKLNPFLKVGCI